MARYNWTQNPEVRTNLIANVHRYVADNKCSKTDAFKAIAPHMGLSAATVENVYYDKNKRFTNRSQSVLKSASSVNVQTYVPIRVGSVTIEVRTDMLHTVRIG